MFCQKKGFSLIELLVCLAILSLLATMSLPLVQTAILRTKENDLRLALREIRNGIDAYKRAIDDGRITLQPGKSGYPPNLIILVEGVLDERDPQRKKIFFLRRIPRDPFFADVDADPESTWKKRSYASEADNPEPGEDVFDVYSSSDKLGLNGAPYKKW